MNKIFLYLILAIIFLGCVFLFLTQYIYSAKQGTEPVPARTVQEATYYLSGVPVKLGTELRYFGNEVYRDFDSDGTEDTAFLASRAQGTSTEYYVVAALNTAEGYEGSHAVYVGVDISPQRTELFENLVFVHYATLGTDGVSIGKSLRLLFDAKTAQFGEVVQNFEGEADPSRMTLTMKSWTWVRADYDDGRNIVPVRTDAFVLTFLDGNRFSATTDCNTVGGMYTATERALTFSDLVSTKMFCEASQESDFAAILESVTGFTFTTRGEMVLEIPRGRASFR